MGCTSPSTDRSVAHSPKAITQPIINRSVVSIHGSQCSGFSVQSTSTSTDRWVRFAGRAIDTDGDPVAALARGYLERSICPRMFGQYRQRLAAVLETVTNAGIDAVVLQNIRFCDLHGSENSLFERDLEARGIPCLKIEREYGPLVEKGRIRMRLDAFLERIA